MRLDPWPSDAVIIVAARAGTERRENMESVIDCACRKCNAALRADTHTRRLAEANPVRHGRPVEYFCPECAVQHDVHSIEDFVDDRNWREREAQAKS